MPEGCRNVDEAVALNGAIEVKVLDIDFKSWKPEPVEVKGTVVCTRD
jgi:hypothetical protein